MLDIAALVTGAAVASVHSRELTEQLPGMTILGWVFLGLAFLWLGLTSAGPFVYVVRRFVSRTDGYPGAADRLWVALGLPWFFAAIYRSGVGDWVQQGSRGYELCLYTGLAINAVLALGWVVCRWIAMNRDGAANLRGSYARSWTELVGSAVAIMWPLQLGLVMVVTR